MENLAIERLGIRGIAARGSHAIHLTSRNGRKNHESIRISGVHASGTGWGVHIKGAEGVLIEDCEFIGNGVKGREGFAHNLYLRRCHGAVVVNTVLSGSTTGNGCNVSYSSNVRIENCEVMNNYFRGIRFADSDGCVVVNSRIGRNGKVGLLANRERVPAKNIEFRDNRVFENGEGGIQARDGVTGVVVNCRSFDNKRFDIDCADTVRKEGNRTKK